jgi:hypothetical protein
LAVITVGALRGIGQDNRASTMARLGAWDKRQIQRLQLQAERQALRLEHKAERHARTVRGAGRMARSGSAKGLAAGSGAEADGGRTG